MRVILKDCIRFAVSADGGAAAQLEIRVRRDPFAGWEASAVMHEQGAPSPVPLGRVFRSRDRRLTTGKMVAWVRRRYVGAEPLATHRSAVPMGKAGIGPDWKTTGNRREEHG